MCGDCFAIDVINKTHKPMGKQMIQTIHQDHRALLGALALIESDNREDARGDLKAPDGPALGLYQIHQSAWDDISVMRKRANMKVYPYHDALKAKPAGEYAYTLLAAITLQFQLYHSAPPSPRLLYACYSLGPSIIKKIPYMDGLELMYSPFEPNGMCAANDVTPLTSVGYKVRLSKRKLADGERFENILLAHHISLRESGMPLLWN